MCDFAADAAAAEQLMVGRTLSVARVRELNAKDYFYQMLKDNPEMLKIYPGIENELLQGAIDCHIHAFPDFVHRSQDMIQIAIEASKCGMRAIAFKDHWNISATSAYLTQRHIDDMIARGELTHRVEVYGGVGMCFGMRPEYVRVGLQYPNFKMIWFPTFTSYGFWRGAGHPEKEGVRLCSEDGKVLPEVKEIMEMAAEKKVGIGFGHTDFQELLPLGRLAKDIGVRATLDHPLLELNKLLLDEMKQLRDLGVYVGTYCQPMIPSSVPTRCRSHGNHPHYPRDRPGPLHHRQRLRPGAAHGRGRRHAGLHPGIARFRHQARRRQGDVERQSGEVDVVG